MFGYFMMCKIKTNMIEMDGKWSNLMTQRYIYIYKMLKRKILYAQFKDLSFVFSKICSSV